MAFRNCWPPGGFKRGAAVPSSATRISGFRCGFNRDKAGHQTILSFHHSYTLDRRRHYLQQVQHAHVVPEPGPPVRFGRWLVRVRLAGNARHGVDAACWEALLHLSRGGRSEWMLVWLERLLVEEWSCRARPRILVLERDNQGLRVFYNRGIVMID
jgi:hypothetical protein